MDPRLPSTRCRRVKALPCFWASLGDILGPPCHPPRWQPMRKVVCNNSGPEPQSVRDIAFGGFSGFFSSLSQPLSERNLLPAHGLAHALYRVLIWMLLSKVAQANGKHVLALMDGKFKPNACQKLMMCRYSILLMHKSRSCGQYHRFPGLGTYAVVPRLLHAL